MSIFKIVGEKIESHEQRDFWFDNLTGKITEQRPEVATPTTPVDIARADLKTGPFRTIKIQLGLSCNYSCSYCLQAKPANIKESSQKNIESFLRVFDALPRQDDVRIEFWGGEPLVYIKTLKPLAEELRQRHPRSQFMLVTNGSLLTHEIIDWLFDWGFCVAISHDGPGQHMRGDDPIVDNVEAIEYAIERLLPYGRLSFSSMLNGENRSRLAIIEYFKKRFPGVFLPSSEMGFVDVYDAGSADSVAFTLDDHFQIRRTLWAEMRFNNEVRAHCFGQSQSIESIVQINRGEVANYRQPGQKCGMERRDTLAIDMWGNVLTCQNVSAQNISENGAGHKIGHATDLNNVRLTTSSHWTMRENCPTCPVLRLCGGSCMFTHGSNFELSCNASYSDKITQLAIAFEQITGFVPIWIEAEGVRQLPPERQDVWGSLLDWSKAERAPKKVISIRKI